MIELVGGPQTGQVLQRRGPDGGLVEWRLSSTERGPVTCSLFDRRGEVKGWHCRLGRIAENNERVMTLSRIPTGGPYRLRISCGAFDSEIADLYVGDVWVLAGQSNMQGYGNMTGASRPHHSVRAFSMAREWRIAADPLHVPQESPDRCHSFGKPFTREEAERHRKTTEKGVGVGAFFGREMYRISGVPQGLICTAHGGTTLSEWDPKAKTTDHLYGSMLTSIRATGQPIAGMLWFQGESDSNAEAEPEYTRRMRDLVSALRRDVRQPNLPWVVCQSARAFGRKKPSVHWNAIQNHQRLLPRSIRNLDVVATVDLPMDDPLHLGSDGFPRLARRMADVAARLAYSDSNRKPTPQPGRIRSTSSGLSQFVDVSVGHVEGELRSAGEPHGFTIERADGTPLDGPFKITLRGDTVRLHLAGPPPPDCLVAYGTGHTPVCNIVDARGHALPVFTAQPVIPNAAWLPFVTKWSVSDVLPEREGGVLALHPAEMETRPTREKAYDESGIVNEHDAWQHQRGLCFFVSLLRIDESMKLEANMGYDGPFRLWVDDKPVFTDLNGMNPCLPDQSQKKLSLSAGVHKMRVVMDLNGGLAWGFQLRFRRCDVTQRQIASGEYIKPVYAVG